MKRKPNAMEQGVLDVVLAALRQAVRMKGQLSIIIDPWTSPPHPKGCDVFVSPNTSGREYEIDERGKARPR